MSLLEHRIRITVFGCALIGTFRVGLNPICAGASPPVEVPVSDPEAVAPIEEVAPPREEAPLAAEESCWCTSM